MIKTVKVTGYVYNQNGEPATNAKGRATLSHYDIDNGVVVPWTNKTLADDQGYFEINLWPNERGSSSSYYELKFYSKNTLVLDAQIVVPDVTHAVEIYDIINQKPYPQLDKALQALIGAQKAAMEAKASANEVEGIATDVSDSVDAAQEAATLAVDTQTDIHTNWQGKLDAAAQQVETATTQAGIATDKAAEASGGAAAANAAKTSAEAARDAAFVNADVYPDVATDLAAVADGEQFQVVEGDEVVRYQNSRGTVVEVARYLSKSGVETAINSTIVYTDEKIDKIDLATPVLTGQEIYDKALINDTKLFTSIWSEYNKPVWHIGSGVFVDAVGAKVKPVVEELVFTLKATQVNQTFYFPTRVEAGESFTVDWGDGSALEVDRSYIRHEYICEIGDEFVVKATGEVPSLEFNTPAVVEYSNAMLISIDKNTLPKVTRAIDLLGCVNLTSVCAGAFSSYSGTALNLQLLSHCPSLVLNKDMFFGLSQVTNINRLFATYGTDINATIPQGLLDPFVNVTSAQSLFVNLSSNVPEGILDKLTNLENVYGMFYGATTSSINPNLFKNQAKLKDVGSCFQFCEAVSDAAILYTDMARGNPTTTENCFVGAENMTNLAEVPAGWK